jgi:hypothetical protein
LVEQLTVWIIYWSKFISSWQYSQGIFSSSALELADDNWSVSINMKKNLVDNVRKMFLSVLKSIVCNIFLIENNVARSDLIYIRWRASLNSDWIYVVTKNGTRSIESVVFDMTWYLPFVTEKKRSHYQELIATVSFLPHSDPYFLVKKENLPSVYMRFVEQRKARRTAAFNMKSIYEEKKFVCVST